MYKGQEDAMKVSKPQMARIFFGLESLIFFGFYFVGSNGWLSLCNLKGDIVHLNEEMVILKQEICQLKTDFELQQNHPFFQEKIAREQLQMARANEEIYLL